MVFDGLNPHDKADKVLLAPKFPDVFTFFGEIKKNRSAKSPCFESWTPMVDD